MVTMAGQDVAGTMKNGIVFPADEFSEFCEAPPCIPGIARQDIVCRDDTQSGMQLSFKCNATLGSEKGSMYMYTKPGDLSPNGRDIILNVLNG
jgi:hypothetical protein